MKTGIYLLVFCILFSLGTNAQYLENLLFEGYVGQPGIPNNWDSCNYNSSPNLQPGKYGVTFPPSDGNTYLGIYARPDNTWEDAHATLNIPFSHDSCYIFKIDFAYVDFLSFTAVDPIKLTFYGDNSACAKSNVLWESPAIDNDEWQTSEFTIHNEAFDITDLVIEAKYTGSFPYAGYALVDNIRIERFPEFNLGNDTALALCSNDSIILDPGPGYVSYLWQDGSTDPTFAADTTGLYWVQAFNNEGCSWTDSIYITFEEYVEMTSNMIDSTLVCSGQELTLTALVENGAPPYSYQWVGFPDTTQQISVISDSTRYYTVSVTDQCGSILMDSIKIVVKEDPEINLGNDTLICPNDNFELHAGPGFILYHWQDGSVDSTFTVTEPGLYWVEVTSIFGCTNSDSINIDVTPPIQLYLGADDTLCVGDSLILNAGSGFSEYIWQNNSTDSTLAVTTSGLYWVTVTDQYGCTASDSIQIDFLPAPEINLGADFELCAGEEQVITPGPGFVSYLWQDGSTNQTYIVTETGIYWVTVDSGCGVAADTVVVQINPAPEPNLGPDTTICNGTTLLLDPGSGFMSYQWQDNSTLPFYSVFSGGYFSVTVSNSYGCYGEDEVFIDIADPMVDLGEDQQMCESDSIILDAGEGFSVYNWQDGNTTQTYNVFSSGTYSVTVEDEYGCTAEDSVTFTFYPHPEPELGPDRVICEGDSTTLQAPSGDFKWYWNGIEGLQQNVITSAGHYTLSVVNPCDSVTDEINIEVDPVPQVYLGEDDVLLPDQVIELDAGSGFDQYVWQDGSGGQFFMVTQNNLDVENPYYYVEVTKGACKNSDTIRIELFRVWVPAVITPNGDGKNDLFRADPERWSGVNNHTMMVYNRWGEEVWESSDFLQGWDARRNGHYVSNGTYYWVLELTYGNNIRQMLKGTLTVLGAGE